MLELLVPLAQVLMEHLEAWVHLVPRERLVPLVLGELVAQLVPPVPRALWVRLAVLELLVPWAQVLLEHLVGWVLSVLQESAVQPALRVRLVLQERRGLVLVPMRPGCGWCLGWRK